MTAKPSPGQLLRQAVLQEQPLQLVGAINAYSALLAQKAGFQALYVSGAGVANASLGLPDLGVSTLQDVATDVRRICSACALPVLVDADTGWGDSVGVPRSTRELIAAGAAGMHLEDQVEAKRCGHRPNKVLVPVQTMVDRLKAALDARTDMGFVVMARTDAYGVEGKQAAIDRAGAYIEAGADMIFAEAMPQWQDYRDFTQVLTAPLLANLTEFGLTPLFTLEQMRAAGVAMVLYPLSAFRAMSLAALEVYETIRQQGTQQALLPRMQTRTQLYEILDYSVHEAEVDAELGAKDAES